jgi:hypothetical protein
VEKITIKKAADILDCSEQFLRVALQQGKLPFGTAVKMSKHNFTYYINPNQFYSFIGQTPPKEAKSCQT